MPSEDMPVGRIFDQSPDAGSNIRLLARGISLTVSTGPGGGECQISLQIRYRDVDLSPELPVKTITLPGRRDFAKPIAIP